MSLKKYAALFMCAVILFLCDTRIVAGSDSMDFISEMLSRSTYRVYQNDRLINAFETYAPSEVFGRDYACAVIKRQGVLWHNYSGITPVDITPLADAGEFEVYQSGVLLGEYTSYKEAVLQAGHWSNSIVTGELAVWNNYKPYRVVDLNDAAARFATSVPDAYFAAENISSEGLIYAVYQNDSLLMKFSDGSVAESFAKKYANTSVIAIGRLWDSISGGDAPAMQDGVFEVYQMSEPLMTFNRYYEAVEYAQKWSGSYIKGAMTAWHNLPRLSDEQLGSLWDFTEYDNPADAVAKAKTGSGLAVITAVDGTYEKTALVWENAEAKGSVMINNVPIIMQMPELPRGCEVTSLCMLLRFNGVSVTKMKLAEEVKKSPLKYDDPNNGFIGNMYTFNAHGLGVYHSPIAELAQKYLPGEIADMTGSEFEDLYYFLDRGQPVWIIINSWFSVLPQSQFITWNTPSGPIRITYREHSVVVVGYDQNYIYYNDPLSGAYKKAPASKFIGGWEQMGRQAVVRIP